MRKWVSPIVSILLIMLTSCSKNLNNSNTAPGKAVSPSENTANTSSDEKPDNIPVDNDTTDKIQETKAIREVQGLVRIDELDSNFVIDLKYATSDNFIGRQAYKVNVCALRRTTAEKLVKANNEFMKDGYRIKIWDGYRPLYVQQIFWDIVKNPLYVADPKFGSSHSTGCTVDVTLVDTNGKEVIMPTAFDDFSTKASRKYTGASKEAKKNLEYLTAVMKRNGFTTINSEWWEYRDTEMSKYPELDIKLEEFLH